jgi:hypothetical protein
MIGSKSNNHKKIKRFYTLNSDWNIINEQGLFCELGGGMDAISLSTISSYDILQFTGYIGKGWGLGWGGGGGGRAPPDLGRSVKPIQTRRGKLCPSHYCQPPQIQKAIYTSAIANSTIGPGSS